MKAALIIMGILLLSAAFICYSIAYPWLTFTPLPALTTVHPLEPFAFLLGAAGIILIIFGVTANTAVRLIFSALTIFFLIALLKGWIEIEWLRQLLHKIGRLLIH